MKCAKHLATVSIERTTICGDCRLQTLRRMDGPPRWAISQTISRIFKAPSANWETWLDQIQQRAHGCLVCMLTWLRFRHTLRRIPPVLSDELPTPFCRFMTTVLMFLTDLRFFMRPSSTVWFSGRNNTLTVSSRSLISFLSTLGRRKCWRSLCVP